MRYFICVCVSAIFFMSPSVAFAQTHMSNIAVATDGMLYAAVKNSTSYWSKKRPDLVKKLNDPITIYVYDELDPNINARGTHGKLYFARHYVKYIRECIVMKGMRKYALALLWRTATHERGHSILAGNESDHANTGIMAANVMHIPRAAFRWANKIMKGNK